MARHLDTSPTQRARTSSPLGYYASFDFGTAVRYCLALLAEKRATRPQEMHRVPSMTAEI